MHNKNSSKNSVSMNALSLAARYAEEYVADIRDRRVSPSRVDLDQLKQFNAELSQAGQSAEDVIDSLHHYGSPATVASTGGRYFGLVVGGATPASMGAAVLNAAWDQVAVLEASAPSAIHLERIAANWVLELLALPLKSSVGFTTGSSMANMVCLAAARNSQYQKLGINLAETGLSGAPALRIIVSEQSHVTVYKALSILGIGTQQLVKAPCDDQGRVRADRFPTIDETTIICLQAGNVNSGSFDPYEEIIPLARAVGAWVHVDGAFGLWAAASPAKFSLTCGVQQADSWAVDAHKWLNTPYDCGLAICRDGHAVHTVMTTQAPYLQAGVQVPPKDMVPEFSRRARGVEVWAAIQEMGPAGIAAMIDRCCTHAQHLCEGLAELGYDILNDVVLNQVVATIGCEDDVQKIVSAIQEEGVCWFGTTVWQGKTAVRLSVSCWATTGEDIALTLASIRRATEKIIVS
ncbi:aminotransferase class V-fold PLP-dependent enzyme [Microbulbifer sp. OS29]|uniref:Aminotransferase class V-fold PLP-dependent enzyme n=1 Tax=Microbulbifer okhotskensis TaxID=2926617 RepID=A0A9X2ENQ0_9GAMM|nr:aminotransferase class V-fold PLP-dependent enzyme [Microbulbifer okhotskensis]MCO1332781.1 aminotransferase class V-fold PLP-dependent enzyme [Microbulbifer okhotskensis]